jgi:biopolymer transport protein ExbD
MEFRTAYRRQIAAAKQPVPWLNVDMSPFLAVTLVLLTLVMLSPSDSLIHDRSIGPALPTITNAQPLPGAAREDAIIVVVFRDGRIFCTCTDSAILIGDLPSVIRQAVGTGSPHHVYLQADERARYAEVKAVVDKIGEAGIKNVSLLSSQGTPR